MVVLRSKLNRRQLTEFAAITPASVIAMEALRGLAVLGAAWFDYRGPTTRAI